MTIGDFLLRRGRQSLALLALWAVSIATIGIVSSSARGSLEFIAFALLVPYGIFRASIKCPRCGKNVATDVEKGATAWFSEPPDHCRYCNVSYNDQMSEKR